MTFLNLSLLAGAGFVLLPIVLHLLMKRQPKIMNFPALRFIKQRQVTNSQQLQIRHWLLLALRCALLAIAALALARPTVASAAVGSWFLAGGLSLAACFLIVLGLVALSRNLGILWTGCAWLLALFCLGGAFAYGVAAQRETSPLIVSEEAPLAAAILVDTAPHMEYKQDNRTRLELAQETAVWLLHELPRDSEVAMLDSSATHYAFSVDMPAAEKSAERLRIAANTQTLPNVLWRAQELVQQSKLERKEIYIVTDLSASAWQVEQIAAWQQRWKSISNVSLYIIDVGIDQPKNISLGELKLSAESLPRGGELIIEANVTSQQLAGLKTLELSLDKPDPLLPMLQDGKLVLPNSLVRGTEGVELTPNGSAYARFALHGLESGVHHGVLRMLGEDGLSLDNVRYFSVEVEEPKALLLVGGPGVATRELSEAIAPTELRNENRARFTCTVANTNDFSQLNWSEFSSMSLIDPSPLDSEIWNKLQNYVSEGGGLNIYLGANAQPVDSFQSLAAREVLGGRIGGKLKTPVRSPEGYLTMGGLNHPLFTLYRSMRTSVPWDRFPVHYYWLFDQPTEDTSVLATYNDGRPAVIEHAVGRGRVLLFTTPACEALQVAGRPVWNELWAGEDAWPWFVLLNESFRYASRLGEGRLNYSTGETVVLPNDLERHATQYSLFTPVNEMSDVNAREQALTIRVNTNPGTYRMRGNRHGPVSRGFSSNLPLSATDLTRITREELNNLLGEGKYQFARERSEVQRVVGQQRVGQEMFPYLLTMLVAIFGLEQLLANRFYKSEEKNDSQLDTWQTRIMKWLSFWKQWRSSSSSGN
jgi:Aerotolerance regulator N-terminal